MTTDRSVRRIEHDTYLPQPPDQPRGLIALGDSKRGRHDKDIFNARLLPTEPPRFQLERANRPFHFARRVCLACQNRPASASKARHDHQAEKDAALLKSWAFSCGKVREDAPASAMSHW